MRKAALLPLLLLTLPLLLFAQEKRIYSDGDLDYAPMAAQFMLTAGDLTDNLDYIEYSVDGGEMQRYTDPIRFENEGRHFITYRAVDITGNVSREKVYTVVIDDTPPEVSASAIGAAVVGEEAQVFLLSDTAVVLEAADRYSGVRQIFINLNDAGFEPYTGPLYFVEEGEHRGYAYAVDNVGNRSETFEATTVVDTTPPAISLVPRQPFRTFGGERYSAPGNEILLRATDRLSGVETVEISVNDRPFQSYSAPVQVREPGFYSIRGRATDRLGNSSRVQELSFYVGVDTPEPEVEPFIGE